jgi:nitric oxide reductase subunit B
MAHWILQVIILVIVVTGFFAGRFSGREYLEFPQWVSLLILFNWVLFMINFFASIPFRFNNAPAYLWMWATGILFYFITMTEAQLWLLPYFNNNIVRDLTIQWKALGSMVGSWNMLVYGTGMYIMEAITKDKMVSRSKTAYFFYFLSLTNLMFNWGHHTYIVPSSPLVKEISYIISMTELLFIGKIIFTWRQSYLAAKMNYHYLPFRILSTGDLWVLLNLILAVSISIPAINRYTHGTHITVAHAMGTTIGINTMLLLGSIFFIVDQINPGTLKKLKKYFSFSMRLLNVSLMVFWVSLLISGVIKSMDVQRKDAFAVIMQDLQPYFKIFTGSGILVMLGLFLILIPLVKLFSKEIPSTE